MNERRAFSAPGWRFEINEQDSAVSVCRVVTNAHYGAGRRHVIVTTGSASEAALAEKRRLDRAYLTHVILYGAGGFTAMIALLILSAITIGWHPLSNPLFVLIMGLGAGLGAAFWFPRSPEATVPGAPVIRVSPEDAALLFDHLSERDRQALTAAIERDACDAVLEELARMIIARIKENLAIASARYAEEARAVAEAILQDARKQASELLGDDQEGKDPREHNSG